MKFYVYALREPDCGPIRYIGKGTNPLRRLAAHASQRAAKSLREWVTRLGRKPEIEILATCETEGDALLVEQREIARLLDLGAPLLNTRDRDTVLSFGRPRNRRFSGMGARMRRLRLAQGLTFRALSAKTGIDATNLSRIERGTNSHCGIESGVLIARALRTTVEWLVTGDNPQFARAEAA